MTTLTKRLSEIQKKLNAPKNQYNSFGKYHYRNCEDILMAVKPLLGDLVITVSDSIEMVADRIYVKAVATITDGETSISTSAFAREAEDKKGMDDSQITGSTSSYARKYALNGLLLIDDNKDADHGEAPAPKKEEKPFDVAAACNAIVSASDSSTAERYAKAALSRASTNEEKARINNALESYKEAA